MNKFSNWRRHRIFNIGRGISGAISFTGILVVTAACGTSDLDLSSLEQLILTFCGGVAVMLMGAGLYLVVEYVEGELETKRGETSH